MKRSRIQEIIREEVEEFGKNPTKQVFNEQEQKGDMLLDQAIKTYGSQMGGVRNIEDIKNLRDVVVKKVNERLRSILNIGEKREL